MDQEPGELVDRGGDLSQAADSGAQDGVGDDDADLAGQRPQPEDVEVAGGDVGGVGVPGRLGELAGVGGGAKAGEDHAAVPGEPLGVHAGHGHASYGQPGARIGPEPVGRGEQGGEVVVVEVDDACQPGPHRLPGLVAAQLVPPGARHAASALLCRR